MIIGARGEGRAIWLETTLVHLHLEQSRTEMLTTGTDRCRRQKDGIMAGSTGGRTMAAIDGQQGGRPELAGNPETRAQRRGKERRNKERDSDRLTKRAMARTKRARMQEKRGNEKGEQITRTCCNKSFAVRRSTRKKTDNDERRTTNDDDEKSWRSRKSSGRRWRVVRIRYNYSVQPDRPSRQDD